MAIPTQEQLAQALSEAGSAHHDYESDYLKGVRDEQWPGFYAAFALGRVGQFTSTTELTRWLEEAPGGDDWARSAAEYVLSKMD